MLGGKIVEISFKYLDTDYLNKLSMHITEAVIFNDKGRRKKYVLYKILVKRGDGLEWFCHLRYSELLYMRKRLLKFNHLVLTV